MKKFAIALAALMFLLIVACGGEGAAQAEEEKDFEYIHASGSGNIIRHNETGVCYLWHKCGYGAGLTLMVNPDGTPYVWEED